jgi:hypothetical protein
MKSIQPYINGRFKISFQEPMYDRTIAMTPMDNFITKNYQRTPYYFQMKYHLCQQLMSPIVWKLRRPLDI